MTHSTDLALDQLITKKVRTLGKLFIGNVRVGQSSTLEINGLMIGNIKVESGARVHVNGLMIGNIIDSDHKADAIRINGWHIGNLLSGNMVS